MNLYKDSKFQMRSFKISDFVVGGGVYGKER